MKIISRIKGGLGNQLFCYAAAYRLATAFDADLVLDTKSGFVRDSYQRYCQLDYFDLPGRKISRLERYYPCGRLARRFLRILGRFSEFGKRNYIEDEVIGFDPRLLEVTPRSWCYLDGFWQSENYFCDVADEIRQIFSIHGDELQNARNSLGLDALSKGQTPIMVHVRWFDSPEGQPSGHNLSPEYYDECMSLLEEHVENPVFFIFSDQPDAAVEKLNLDNREYRVGPYEHSYADNDLGEFRLMQVFNHFIIANSTFSWWAAWHGEVPESKIFCPSELRGRLTNWGLNEMLPSRWKTVEANYV